MEYPLVSVMVGTYNSSDFVIETLESVRSQNYPQIELIVTDDGSIDDTVKIVKNWLNEYGSEFVGSLLVESPVNTGIPANVNRGLKACNGEWIRLIAGDDLLAPESIKKQITYVTNTRALAFVGDIKYFTEINNEKVFYDHKQLIDKAPWFFESSSQYQYEFLLKHYNFGLLLGSLFNRSVFEVSMFDERYPLEEDTLFQLNITRGGIKFYYLKEPIVYYRIHNSVSNVNDRLLNKGYEDSKRGVKRDHIYPKIPWYDFIYWESEAISNLIYYIVFNFLDNKANIFNKRLINILRKFDLLYYKNLIADRFQKEKWMKEHKS